MTTYHLAYISETRPIISNTHVSELLNINNLEDAEKILAAEFYTLNAKKCKNNIALETPAFKFTSDQYKDEFQQITKQFLEETPKEFLRLNNFKVVEKIKKDDI